jgi:hypothetical protein
MAGGGSNPPNSRSTSAANAIRSSRKASEPSRNDAFWTERNRFYVRKAGLPE